MANETQIDLWNDANAKRWLRIRAALGPMLEPFGDAALRTLAPRPGELALDVGCGLGETTRDLAARTRAAVGVDVSRPFIEIARREATSGVRYLVADAQTHAFEEKFDLLYSRFGVMFFDDPQAAFRNLAVAMRPGGRMAFAVWGPFEENTWANVPLAVVRRHFPGPAAPVPGQPGPFALSDRDRLASLLGAAGFAQVSIAPLEIELRIEPSVLVDSGPVAAVLREAGEAGARLRPQLEGEIAKALPGEVRALALVASAVRA